MRQITQTDALRGITFSEAPDPSQVDKPYCPICGGLGVVRLDIKDIKDPRFGKLHPCPDPDCPGVRETQRTRQELVNKKTHWDAAYDEWTFESWRAFVDNKQGWHKKGGAYCAAFGFADYAGVPFTLSEVAMQYMKVKWDVPATPFPNVVLTGPVGMGKTGLAVAAVNALKAQDKPVMFLRVQQLVKAVQETYAKDWDGPKEDEILNVFCTTPFLVIDEFGVKNYSSNRLETMEHIMRSRDRAGLPFMATTNLSLTDFYKSWGDQTADIVAKAHWVPIEGKKLRETVTKEVETF